MAVETDDLRQHVRREHGHAAALLFKNDLQEDAARQVFAALGVDDLEFLVGQDQLLDICQGDVGAGPGVV
ncbi:hypothetical protein D3C72_2161960 [compost metagenome]